VILTVARNRLMNLRHDRSAFVLSFVVPIVFFSIFAAIFGSASGRSTTNKIAVAVVDEDQTDNSRRFLEALRSEAGLKVATELEPKNKTEKPAPFTAATAEAAVRAGQFPVALVIPKGFGSVPIRFGPEGQHPRLILLSDPSDPIAPHVLAGLVQKVAMTAMPESMARGGMDEIDRWSGGLTPEQRARMEEVLARIRQQRPIPSAGGPRASEAEGNAGLVSVEQRAVLGQKKKNPMIAFYAAGIGVMFLLFSAAGAGGALIEEAESGTLDRILSTRVSMTKLLAGKLLYLAWLAATQLLVMFVWGSMVFGLEMRGHWGGFLIMTVATALAASTFGLLLAAVSRSRMQLVALSNLSILAMSAIGGSMFPRFLMPEFMQKIGLVTINAWAIDGFQKVFWREEPTSHLLPQVAVLVGVAIVLFAAARRLARRWEAT
jgi:ABC-2 type transport system permease protein